MTSNDQFETGRAPFCANSGCPLHVRPGEPGVLGVGNWIQLANGIVLGRQLDRGRLVCDACANHVPCPL